MDKTPRKSLQLNKQVMGVDSPPIVNSRPSYELNAFTQSPDNKIKQYIVIDSTSSYKVQKNTKLVADTKTNGKEKVFEGNLLLLIIMV
ncbi:hypothetical protein H5410_037624 [Solanum commersonii]|uniref:Uncharacterized protein n=1 Tax=Solanum commersonii TaxID=4109 RepID=A0A9J5YA14_SOLCO|nr:hypothetical protein H5410_037624 [Solanum commersonii]